MLGKAYSVHRTGRLGKRERWSNMAASEVSIASTLSYPESGRAELRVYLPIVHLKMNLCRREGRDEFSLLRILGEHSLTRRIHGRIGSLMSCRKRYM